MVGEKRGGVCVTLRSGYIISIPFSWDDTNSLLSSWYSVLVLFLVLVLVLDSVFTVRRGFSKLTNT